MGVPEKNFIVETNGSGVCLIDYNNDGWLDIYLVNGSTFDALDGKEDPSSRRAVPQQPRRHVYRCCAQAGVQNDRWGYGARVADYDNDGWPDIYVGNYGKNRLYHNNHDGTFTDVAEKAGVALGNWSPGSSVGRLRRRRPARSLRHRLRPLRSRQSSHRRHQGGGLRVLPVSRRDT